MRKFMYFAAALLVLVGCNNKDNIVENAPEGTPFEKGQQVTLTIGTGAQQGPNRVAGVDNTTDNKIDFTWEEGDKILVKVGDESAEFTLTTGVGTETGTFSGIMPASGTTFDLQYPKEAIDLSTQVYTAGDSIPADKMLFTASNCTLGTNATLKAQYAMVQFNLYGTDKTVGKIVFTDKTASPAVSYTLSTGGKTIGTASASATPFYMVVPTGEYKFEVEVWDNATTPAMICSFATSAAKSFTAGQCANMPAKFVPTYVDLGLTVKWATCNVGADAPEGYGDYFAWGETEPYYVTPITDPITWKTGKGSGYAWASYFDTKDNGSTFIKYNLNGGKTVLELADDAAAANWGGTWRMPTNDEIKELLDENKCSKEWTTQNNVSGYKFTSRVSGYENKSIFLPASGYRSGASLFDVGSYGDYWSSSLYEDYSGDACSLGFYSDYVGWDYVNRSDGLSVRPVCQ